MSFLDLFGFEPDEAPPDEPSEVHEPMPWLAPLESELGVSVPLSLIVARSEKGVVAVPHATVYSNGVQFELLAQARGLRRGQANRMFHEQHGGLDDEEGLPDGFLRVGIELPGGARVSNLMGRRMFHRRQSPPDGPVLMMHGGGGGQTTDNHVSMRPGYWLWPLPEPGILRLSCEWPIAEIALHTVEIDATRIHEAAQQVSLLWPA